MSKLMLSSLLVSIGSVLASKSAIVLVGQNSDSSFAKTQQIETYGGNVTKNSNLLFTFSMPYVQMTTDTVKKEYYLTTYPTNNPQYSGPEMYKLDENLQKQFSYWANFSFFDLQYSVKQDALYGIYVSSTYGRVLTNYTLPTDGTSEITKFQPLFTLPYMWYVNASSFDATTSTYFALLNNFPGKENSTTDQILLVADLSRRVEDGKEAPVKLFPIVDDGLSEYPSQLQYIAYSAATETLYYSGARKVASGITQAGVLDHRTGKASVAFSHAANVALGPLVADDNEKSLYIFNYWINYELYKVTYDFILSKGTDGYQHKVTEYTPDQYVHIGAAVTSSL